MKEVNENLKNLKIIIGKDGYGEQNIKCTKNELTSRNSCRQFYRHFETVAFVTREKVPFKRTFEHILNLLYYKKNINVRKKYESITQDWISFVECMFNNESIVFINQDELDHHNKNHKYIIENAHAILMCGKWSQQGGNPLHFSLHFYVLSCCETQSACFNDFVCQNKLDSLPTSM